MAKALIAVFAIVGVIAIFSENSAFITKAKASTESVLVKTGEAFDSMSSGVSNMWDALVEKISGDEE